VAYADFVTAMMALFLCLWLTAQDEKIKEAIERAFRQPYAIGKESPSSLLPMAGKETEAAKSRTQGALQSSSALELAMLRKINEDLMKTIESHQEEDLNETVKLELTPEGLRISVFDRARKPTFETNSTELTPFGEWVFSTLAWTLSRYASFGVELEGHTERGRAPIRVDYGAWELSSDRANSARRSLLNHGVEAVQVRKVSGFGDTTPLPHLPPEEDANRRVSVLLKVMGGGNI
jgi:chemotaxis protein MotB